MQIKRKIFMLTIVLVFSFFSLCLGAEDPRFIYDYPVNPKQTYFRTCNDSAPWSFPVDLTGTNGVFPGDWIVLRRLGAYKRGGAFSDTEDSLVGVFSPTGYIKPDNLNTVNRIYDPISINKPFVTMETYSKCAVNQDDDPENLPTDIPQDFFIDSIALQVPSSARYLYLTPNDSRFSDNSDPDNDYMLRLTDDVIWDGGSSVDNRWDNKENWDTNEVPRPDFGVTFDEPGDTLVDNYDSEIKYLRIVDGAEVRFGGGSRLWTTNDNPEKYSLLVDGAKLYWARGDLSTNYACIGYKAHGELYVYGGSKINFIEGTSVAKIAGSSGGITVDGNGTILQTDLFALATYGSGYLKIQNEGHVDLGGIRIGGYSTRGLAYVLVNSGGKLDGLTMIIGDRGTLVIDQGSVYMDSIHVYSGGGIRGCNTGFVTGTVMNNGGDVEPGCSTGKLVIDGDYIQKAGGTLEIEVGGYQQKDDYDVLEVTGNVTLDGTIQLDFVHGFAPKKGDVFEFLKIGGTANGSFSDVSINGLQDGFQYDISLEGGVAKLTALNNGVPKSTISPIIHLLLRDTDAGK